MNTDLAIAVVTSVMSDIIGSATGLNINTLSPASPPGNDASPQIYLYLYQVIQNPHWRNQDLSTRRGDGSFAKRPRIALDLNYLLTFYGSESQLIPQKMLGTTMCALHAQPIISRERITNWISGLTESDQSLAGYDPVDCFETIRISPLPLSLEDMSKLWSIFFQKPYALSVAYQASVVLIEAEETISVPLPVAQPKVYVLPIHKPVIERITVEGDDPRIFTDSTIVITGHDLAGDITKIRINSQEKVVQPETDDRIEVELSDLAGLHAGVCGVQVLHATMMGEPAEPRDVIASNVAAVVLHPQVAGISLAQRDFLSVTMTHPVGPSQRVYLLLNSISGTNGFSYPASDRPNETNDVQFPVSGLIGGHYLVRIQVDGAESRINLNDNSPQISICTIRGGEEKPKYNHDNKIITLLVDPKVEESSPALTVKLTSVDTAGPGPFSTETVEIGPDRQTLIFSFSDKVVVGRKYRIELTINGISAINQPEIDI